MSINTSSRGRVLIVDDDRKILDLLVELLQLEGYDVATATDGSEALDLALSFDPDVVLSDVVMPEVGGLELCRRLKDNPRTAYTPVMLISGRSPSDDAGIEGLHAGADDYLDLPFRNEELLVKVARLVERHRMEGALKESEERYRRLVELSPDAIVDAIEDILGRLDQLIENTEHVVEVAFGQDKEVVATYDAIDALVK